MASLKNWIRGLVLQTESCKQTLRNPARRSGRASAWDRLSARLDQEQLIDEWAQSIVCCRAGIDICGFEGIIPAIEASAGPIVRAVVADLDLLPETGAGAADADPTFFYEQYLSSYRGAEKSNRGVYYTPRPLARYLVAELSDALRSDFCLRDGLADAGTWRDAGGNDDAEPSRRDGREFVQILDPAMGSGIFLVEAIGLIRETLTDRWAAEGASSDEISNRWNRFVAESLLRRLAGVELSLPALTISHLNVVAALARTGYRFEHDGRLRLGLADTLFGPESMQACGTGDDELAIGCQVAFDYPATVILGNPPFSGISPNQGEWMQNLLRGRDGSDTPVANYYEVEGKRLRERKLWLQDDYVKFMRHAHWRIERSGAGLIGFVTNHGYLDNATFRGMRESLLGTFVRITILDLHGNRKKHEVGPDNEGDENLFSIEQGTAVGVFSRPLGDAPAVIRHSELWGPRDRKLAALDRRGLDFRIISPTGPHYFLTPTVVSRAPAYSNGHALPDVMPVHSTAAVTARDRLVIGMSYDELCSRLERFRDLSIDDDVIREEFGSSRSRQYLRGDTRGWRLAEARRKMAGTADWKTHITQCLYRPYDERSIFWADWMIDWPRREVMRHMACGGNLAIIARRQMLPTQPCSFFWVTNRIAVDGVIRSDNRGSESIFPLYLKSPETGKRQANFSAAFLNSVQRSLGWKWRKEGSGDLIHDLGPNDLLQYIYAIFHSNSYRTSFQTALRIDFPRIPLPRERQLFRALSDAGDNLVRLHLPSAPRQRPPRIHGPQPVRLKPGFPRFHDERIYLADEAWFDNVGEQVWSFRVGGHQVCRKWLRDRRHRELSTHDWQRYEQMVDSLAETVRWMTLIDEQIENAGGWAAAFIE